MLRRRRMERREDELVKFIDFFAGIGGIRLGLERAGHECIGFCEFDKFARQSYKAIHNTKNEWEAHDVRTVNSTDVPKADLWCFGFPCQDLSVAGKQKGLQAGERSGLFYEIMRLLAGLQKEDRPKYLLVENVKNLLSIGGGFDFLRLLVEMGGHGYDVEWQVLNSKDFGVPQNRERVFLVGHLGGASGREVFPLRRTDGENPCTSEEQRPIRLGNIYGEDRGTGYAGNVCPKHSIAPTLTTMAGGNREPMIIDAIYNNREPRVTEISPTLRADRQGLCVGGDIKLIGNYMPSGHSAGNVYDVNGIAPTVMDNHGLASAVLIDKNGVRETEEACTLDACYYKGVGCNQARTGVLVREATKQGYTEAFEGDSVNLAQPNSQTRRGRVGKQIANTLTCGDTMGVVVKPVLTPDRAEKQQNGRRIKENGEPMFTLTAQDRHGVAIIDEQNKCFRKDGNIGTLTTDGSSPKHNNRIAIIGGLQEHQKVRSDGISPCLTQAMGMGGGQTPCVLGTRIRKLTPRECWRLQGFPDDYFDRAVAAGVSNSQLYKQAGNAVTVNVAEAIGRRLREIELGWLNQEECNELVANLEVVEAKED